MCNLYHTHTYALIHTLTDEDTYCYIENALSYCLVSTGGTYIVSSSHAVLSVCGSVCVHKPKPSSAYMSVCCVSDLPLGVLQREH